MQPFISFEELTSDNYGGKANSLAKMRQAGLNVPNGFVIPSDAIETILTSHLSNAIGDSEMRKDFIQAESEAFTPLAKEAWKYATELLGNAPEVAVRSSVNLEDGTTFSFAGQFSTVLEVKHEDDFITAVLTCIRSMYNDTAIAYCNANDIDPSELRINVVVQQMVNPDHAGVCFTVNPMTGNEKEILVESINGLGENLVSGLATPSSYNVNWFDETVHVVHQVEISKLSEKELQLIANEALKIQQLYGFPLDIEWALKDGKLYLLQARPMTAIRFETEYDWTNADLKDGGISSEIATPFMYSLYERAFESTMSDYLASVKIHPKYEPKKWFTQHMLYSYWNLTAVKDGVKKIPGFIEREFDNDLGIEPLYEGKGHTTKLSIRSIINGIQVLLAIKKSIAGVLYEAPNELVRIRRVIEKYRFIDYPSLSDQELTDHANELMEVDFLSVEGVYFVIIYTNSNNTTLFKEYLEKKNKSGQIEYLNLITGLQNISHLRPTYELWEMSRKILTDAKSSDYFKANSTAHLCEDYLTGKDLPFRPELEYFIERYGYHSEKELQILTPKWDKNPTQVFATLKNLLEKSDEESVIRQNEKQHAIFQEEMRKISSKKMRTEIEKHRELLWLREEFRDHSSQMHGIIAKIFYEMGARILKAEKVDVLEDIFFLDPEQIIELFKGTDHSELIRKNKIIHTSFRNFDRPNEIWVNQSGATKKRKKSGSTLNGIACSNGFFEGEVFIAHSIQDAEKMPNGRIMVTKFTDPAWTVYFSKISGLITETGGMLSHGAIISREYGIPAVLAVDGALETLKTGDLIRLNGNDGSVEIVKKAKK